MMSKSLLYSVAFGGASALRLTHNELHLATWVDTSSYDSYKWNPEGAPQHGALWKIDYDDKAALLDSNHPGCPTPDSSSAQNPFSKEDFKARMDTTTQAQFMRVPSTPVPPQVAYNFDAGWIPQGFGKFQTLGHGTYCPTEDPNFFYNMLEDSFMWYNFINNKWVMGKPSVTWWWETDASTPRTKPVCKEDTEGLPLCGEGELAEMDGDCPKCINDKGRGPDYGDCTAEREAQCDLTSIKECKDSLGVENARPARDAVSCCPICVVKPKCDKATATSCPAAPKCTTDEEYALSWNPETCCFSCTRPDPVTTTECTPEAIDKCVKNTPVCVDLEEPKHGETTGHCCPSCQRPGRQWSCTADKVAACESTSRACATNEVPQVLDGECCSSCKIVSLCTETCSDSQTCAFSEQKEAYACMDKTTSTSSIKTDMDLSSMDTKSVADILAEMVNRYCDVPERAECADGAGQAVSTSLSVTDVSSNGDTVTITTESAVPASNRRRGLLSVQDLLTSAMADLDAAKGIISQETPTEKPTEKPTDAPVDPVDPNPGNTGNVNTGYVGSASGTTAGFISAMAAVSTLLL